MLKIAGDSYDEIYEEFFRLLKDAEEVCEEIKDHIGDVQEAMAKTPVDADTLSDKIVDLAQCGIRLGTRVSDAGMLERMASKWYERAREGHKVRLVREGEETDEGLVKFAAGVADSMKEEYVVDEFKLQNAAKAFREELSNLRYDIDGNVDAIRSKLSFEKSDYKNS